MVLDIIILTKLFCCLSFDSEIKLTVQYDTHTTHTTHTTSTEPIDVVTECIVVLQISLDWEKINAKIAMEAEKESEKT